MLTTRPKPFRPAPAAAAAFAANRARWRAVGRGIGLLAAFASAGCSTVRPELGQLAEPGRWVVLNGEAGAAVEGAAWVARLAPVGGDGKGSNFALALVPGSKLREGTIEVDLRGNGEGKASFLGIAFGVEDERTHEAVYFRPFNFRATDPDRRAHAVQYVAQPDFPWDRLRAERNGVFEKALDPAPDPAGWFHARIEVTERRVSVYVDGEAESSLAVDRLVPARDGSVALWVDSQPGAFANLEIRRRR